MKFKQPKNHYRLAAKTNINPSITIIYLLTADIFITKSLIFC